ncbi:MAG: hypothetical protein CR996_02060 [Draconibacterium sp.]|nr:MAG: hypothetical protein CR996_02060 [Draconibacterium sp.]PIF05053.1 MAG: hypothetical protein CSA36_08650 [Draconibacterium sp.]
MERLCAVAEVVVAVITAARVIIVTNSLSFIAFMVSLFSKLFFPWRLFYFIYLLKSKGHAKPLKS